MRWEKRGLIFAPDGSHEWKRSHASLPVALDLGTGRHRVYFASRDSQNRSHVGWFEIDLGSSEPSLTQADSPVLAPGPLGHFDDHGTYAASIVRHGQRLHLYYIGWNPGAHHPLFYSSIGLAISEDEGLSFQKVSRAPLMARGEHDPWMVTSPYVMLDDGRWRMWYVSGLRWEGSQSYYHIKYAESTDGFQWDRKGHVAIDLRPGEKHIARPCVLKEDGRYRMWYSYNPGDGYRIGYAESPDGYDWERLDDMSGMALSEEGWDSLAQAYPWVFRQGRSRYMLYNGNGFGKEGIGLAVCG